MFTFTTEFIPEVTLSCGLCECIFGSLSAPYPKWSPLPAFYFFHMSSFYVPDKLKLVCQVCKYILSAPFWVMGSITDGIMVNPEEIYFGEEVPIDFV